MDKGTLEVKRRQKQEYMEKLRVEMTATVGQLAMLDELIKDIDTAEQKKVGEGTT